MKDPVQVFGRLLLTSLVAGASLVFQHVSWSDDVNVTGTATYRERMALPPAAVFEATLEDISRADVRAEVLGSVRIEDPGLPPFSFEIACDPAQVQANHAYAVRARIAVQGCLLFTTDQVYPVLTRGHGQQVELLLRRAGGSLPVSRAPLHWISEDPTRSAPDSIEPLEYPERGE
jgi:putative lipoprotein